MRFATKVTRSGHPAAAVVVAAVADLADIDLTPLDGELLLDLARTVQAISHRLDSVAVAVAGRLIEECDAAQGRASSTATLLRDVLNITAAEAHGRVRAAEKTQQRISLTGERLDPPLPLLAAAMADGMLSGESASIVCAAMSKLHKSVDAEGRELCEKVLVEQATMCDPVVLRKVARHILAMADPDGTLDDDQARKSMELHIGRRKDNGLTHIWGELDDATIEMLHQVLGPLARPRHQRSADEHDMASKSEGDHDNRTGPTESRDEAGVAAANDDSNGVGPRDSPDHAHEPDDGVTHTDPNQADQPDDRATDDRATDDCAADNGVTDDCAADNGVTDNTDDADTSDDGGTHDRPTESAGGTLENLSSQFDLQQHRCRDDPTGPWDRAVIDPAPGPAPGSAAQRDPEPSPAPGSAAQRDPEPSPAPGSAAQPDPQPDPQPGRMPDPALSPAPQPGPALDLPRDWSFDDPPDPGVPDTVDRYGRPAWSDPPDPGDAALRDTRAAPLRRAQALGEALQFVLAAGVLPVHGGERPHISVTIDQRDLAELVGPAVLGHGAVLAAGTARRLACDAKVLPIVLGGDSRVLDVGRARYTFPPHVRAAITVRDRGCAWPGCDRPPSWTECHHIQWWSRDTGPTSYENGCLLCQGHHIEAHRDQWTIRMGTDGRPEFVPPSWIDAERTPRRNTANRLIPRDIFRR